MLRWGLWLPLKLLRYWLTLVGLIALVLAAMIATPLKRPPEMTQFMNEARKGLDLSTLPPLERFQARDGTSLGYRHYVAAMSSNSSFPASNRFLMAFFSRPFRPA